MEPLEFDTDKIIEFLCIFVCSYSRNTVDKNSIIIEYCEKFDNIHIYYKESHDGGISYEKRYHMMERSKEGFIFHSDYMSWIQCDFYITQLEIEMFWNFNIKED